MASEEDSSSSLTCQGTPVTELRVIDIKKELENRGLSKSGSKTQLTERLKAQLLLEKLQQDAAQSSGDEMSEGKAPNMALQDDKAGQNEFVRQYLQQQQRNMEIQMEVKKQVEEERKRKSADESSADESIANPDESKAPVKAEVASSKKFKVDESNAPAKEGIKMPRASRKSSRNASKGENGQEKDMSKDRSRSPSPENDRLRERTRSGSSSSSHSPTPEPSGRGRRGRPKRGRAKRGGRRGGRQARKSSPSSSPSSSPEEVMPKKKRRSTNSISSRSRSRSPPHLPPQMASPEQPTRRSSRKTSAALKSTPDHTEVEVPDEKGNDGQKKETQVVKDVVPEAQSPKKRWRKRPSTEGNAGDNTKLETAPLMEADVKTAEESKVESTEESGSNGHLCEIPKDSEIAKESLKSSEPTDGNEGLTEASDKVTSSGDALEIKVIPEPVKESHENTQEEKTSGGRLSRWRSSRSKVTVSESSTLTVHDKSLQSQKEVKSDKEHLNPATEIEEKEKIHVDTVIGKLPDFSLSDIPETSGVKQDTEKTKEMADLNKSPCEQAEVDSEKKAGSDTLAADKPADVAEKCETKDKKEIEKENQNASDVKRTVPENKERRSRSSSSSSSSRSRSRSKSPEQASGQKRHTSSSQSGSSSSGSSRDSTPVKAKMNKSVQESAPLGTTCQNSEAAEESLMIKQSEDDGSTAARPYSSSGDSKVSDIRELSCPSTSKTTSEKTMPNEKDEATVESLPKDDDLPQSASSDKSAMETHLQKEAVTTDEPESEKLDSKKEKATKKRKWGSKTSKATKTPKRTTSMEISSDSLKGLIGEVKLTETVFDMETEVVNTLDYEPEEDRRDIKVKRTVVQSSPKTSPKPEEDTGDQEEDARKVETRDNTSETLVSVEEPEELPKKIIKLSTASPKEGGKKKKILKEKKKKEEAGFEKEKKEEESTIEEKKADKITAVRRPSKPLLPQADEPQPIGRSQSPPMHPKSRVIRITGLVRPFTLGQLKELLKRTGELDDDLFWINSIKSHCLAAYKTEDDAVKTRGALHGTKWPQSNPKILAVDFTTVEEIQQRKEYGDAAPPPARSKQPEEKKNQKEQEEKDLRQIARDAREKERQKEKEAKEKRDKERQRKREDEKKIPVREWDRDKIQQLSRSRSRSRDRGRQSRKSQSRSREREQRKRQDGSRDKKEDERRKERKQKEAKAEEEPPAKLLDDLFKKTKATPCIYWLPLTEEQAQKRMAQKEEREKERQKRLAAIEERNKEEERKREAARQERLKERERERMRERERERGRERGRQERRKASRSRSSSRSRSRRRK